MPVQTPAQKPVETPKVETHVSAGTGTGKRAASRLWISTTIWFVVLLILADYSVSYFFPRTTGTAHQKKWETFFPTDSHPDLLVLGASVAIGSAYDADKTAGYLKTDISRADYVGMDHLSEEVFKQTGKRFSAANLSCYGSMCCDTWAILKKVIEFKKTPRVVVYETISRDYFDASLPPAGESPYYRYMSELHPKTDAQGVFKPFVAVIDGIQSSRVFNAISLILADDQVFSSQERMRKSIDSIFCAVSNLYGNRLTISSRVMNYAGAFFNKKDSAFNAALVAQMEHKKKNPYADLSSTMSGSYQVDETPQLKRYEQERIYALKLAKLCKENGIRLVLVNMPSQPGYKALRPYGLKDKCPSEIFELARANGAEVVDLDNAKDFPPAEFKDDLHLNAHGSMKLNRMIAEQLTRRNIFDGITPARTIPAPVASPFAATIAQPAAAH